MLSKFMQNWKPFTGELPSCCKADWGKLTAIAAPSAMTEKARCDLWLALRSAAEQWHPDGPLNESVQLCFKPSCLRSLKEFKVGELCLVPIVASLASITDKESASSIQVDVVGAKGGEIQCLYINKPAQPKDSDMSKWNKTETVSPFFWAKEYELADAKVANVAVKYESHNGFKIPYVTNTKVLKPGSVIASFKKPAEPKRKLEGVSDVGKQVPKAAPGSM